MLQVEHRGEGGAEALRRMLLYHHHHCVFHIESGVVLYMVHVRCVNQMHKIFKKTNHYT